MRQYLKFPRSKIGADNFRSTVELPARRNGKVAVGTLSGSLTRGRQGLLRLLKNGYYE
jgi:hypothetical protein